MKQLQDVARDISRGNLLPVYVLGGDCEFFRYELRRHIKKHVVMSEFADIDFERFEVSNSDDVIAALQAADTPTFSSGRRLVVVTGGNIFGGKVVAEAVTDAVCEYMVRPCEHAVVVFEEDSIDKRRKTTKLARKQGFFIDCSAPKGKGLEQWLQKRARSCGVELDSRTGEAMIVKCGTDPGTLAMELEKASVYAGGSRVSTEDVNRVCAGTSQDTAFELVEAAMSGDTGKALEILDQLLRHNEVPVRLLALLHSQVRTLFQVKALVDKGGSRSDIGKRVKAHPYVIGKCVSRARDVSVDQLRRWIGDLHEADVAIKTGRLTDTSAIELLLCKMV